MHVKKDPDRTKNPLTRLNFYGHKTLPDVLTKKAFAQLPHVCSATASTYLMPKNPSL
jgi:hypothetical protein